MHARSIKKGRFLPTSLFLCWKNNTRRAGFFYKARKYAGRGKLGISPILCKLQNDNNLSVFRRMKSIFRDFILQLIYSIKAQACQGRPRLRAFILPLICRGFYAINLTYRQRKFQVANESVPIHGAFPSTF